MSNVARNRGNCVTMSFITYEPLQEMHPVVTKMADAPLCGLRFDSGMGIFNRYSSVIQQVDTLREIRSGADGRVVLAVVRSSIIVGYVACWHPDPEDRWSKLGDVIYEMGAIEVSRGFRGRGLARQMIATVLSDDFFEDKIACLSSFSWHWDLEGTGLSIPAYRKMLAGLMESHGFLEYYTNEPNIAIKKENLFMARVGSRISARDKRRFHDLRFGVIDV